MKQITGKSPVYFESGTWHIRKKALTEDLNVCYIEEGGYSSEEEAYEAYGEQLVLFKKKLNLLKKAKPSQFEFREYLIHWYHNIYVPRSDGSTKIAAGYVLYHFILPSLHSSDDIPLTAVSVDSLNQLIKRCTLCKTSVKQTYKFLQAAFSDAFADGYITENVMLSVEKQYWPNPEPVIIYTKEQIKLFLHYISHHYRQIYLEVVLALFCGLRTGEIRGFMFDDADQTASTISIKRQVTPDHIVYYLDDRLIVKRNGKSVKAPKSDSGIRVLRVHKIVFELLEERLRDIERQKEKSVKWTDKYDGYVCIGNYGEIKSEGTCNAALKRICNYTGLPVVSMHDLRHMAASLLFESGVDLIRISAFLGHKNPNTTFDLYIEQIEGSPRLKEIINNTLNPTPQLSYAGGDHV